MNSDLKRFSIFVALQIKWSLPSSEELKAAQELIDEFLGRELTSIHDFIAGKVDLKREQLQNSLTIICGILVGAGNVLPHFQAEPMALIESQVKLEPLVFKCAVEEQNLTFKGQNLREEVIKTLDSLQAHLLQNQADDHKSLALIISGYEQVMKSFGIASVEYHHHKRGLSMVKSSLENRLFGSRRTLRPLLIDRAMIEHESRMIERSKSAFTPIHASILNNLVKLATSHYAIVRIRAQEVIRFMTSSYSYSYKLILDSILHLIDSGNNEEQVSHDAFKGALYLLLGSDDKSMLTKHDWTTLNKVWPKLVMSRQSEKPSIAKLMNQVMKILQKHSETFALENKITNDAVDKALALIPDGYQPSESGNLKIVSFQFSS